MYDVITIGEALLRLTPPNLQRIGQSNLLEVHVGGSESNTAIGLARLGLRVAWLSRLPDNDLGRLVEQTIRTHGVDTQHVIWTNEDRLGLYFVEEGKAPRYSRAIYDRQFSAMSRIQPSDISAGLFQRDNARLLHLTGITLSISDSAAQTAAKVVQLAKQAGWLVSFDTNYRQNLLGAEEAIRRFEPLMEQADIIFIPLKDAQRFYGNTMPPHEHLNALGQRFQTAVIVMTMGKAGALSREPDGSIYEQAAFEAVEVGRIGGGDAFSAGFLYGYLDSGDIPQALRWGAAAAAMKYSIPGDLPLFTHHEVLALVENESQDAAIRR
ncbi:MAG: sugar kinase [Chloroflexi bacterium]|nr:sugar kinase [Chloroflexota bacterium]